jgi:hypothetical protein
MREVPISIQVATILQKREHGIKPCSLTHADLYKDTNQPIKLGSRSRPLRPTGFGESRPIGR